MAKQYSEQYHIDKTSSSLKSIYPQLKSHIIRTFEGSGKTLFFDPKAYNIKLVVNKSDLIATIYFRFLVSKINIYFPNFIPNEKNDRYEEISKLKTTILQHVSCEFTQYEDGCHQHVMKINNNNFIPEIQEFLTSFIKLF